MSIFIRRKKLFEEGEQTAQSQQSQGTVQNAGTTQPVGQNAAPVQQSQQAPSHKTRSETFTSVSLTRSSPLT